MVFETRPCGDGRLDRRRGALGRARASHQSLNTPTGPHSLRPSLRACPDSENMPYSADCIAFMQGDGASEMRWRVNAAGRAPAEQRSAPKNIESTAVASGAACADN